MGGERRVEKGVRGKERRGSTPKRKRREKGVKGNGKERRKKEIIEREINERV